MPLALIGSVTDLAELQGGVGAKIDHVKQATRCPGVTLRETRVSSFTVGLPHCVVAMAQRHGPKRHHTEDLQRRPAGQ